MSSEDYPRYTTSLIAAAFEVSLETIRIWCTEFERYLSPRANPGHRQKRAFTDEDLSIFALIADLKNDGMTYQDIHAALENGERGEPPIIDEIEVSDALILRQAEQRLALQIQQLQGQLTELKSSNERLEGELKRAQEERDEAKRDSLRNEVRVELLQEQLEKTERRVNELLSERSKLEREIGSMESDLRRKDDD